MMVEVDKLFAECIGFREIEHTDYGGIVGRRPDGSIRYIPSPSTKIDDFHNLLQYMLGRYRNITLSMGEGDSQRVEINHNVYEASELRLAVIKAFLGEMNEKN